MSVHCDYCGRECQSWVSGREGNFFTRKRYCSEKCRREAEGVTAEEAKREEAKKRGFGHFLFKFFRFLVITGLIIGVVTYFCINH